METNSMYYVISIERWIYFREWHVLELCTKQLFSNDDVRVN